MFYSHSYLWVPWTIVVWLQLATWLTNVAAILIQLFYFLQEAANMLRLMQNRLKEEEQLLLKGASKWDFFTTCISS